MHAKPTAVCQGGPSAEEFFRSDSKSADSDDAGLQICLVRALGPSGREVSHRRERERAHLKATSAGLSFLGIPGR